ncbi:MAG: tetraacyldisaccharide 4'-kinase [Bacteroidetes bacterium]|jgi:tetraacyldisaccharide 4'-kinase|nr:tetraacyldisaccharide 4'-kinase [Bacteroidota bacterium]MBT5528159.1 tetraacyldisaccharide 4'-kinase [Cytophagia bacterium]MBT3424724.1 tetraacyldisaccharide 4'-kinase [Bacteroidota bacterium]MBT3799857.1 tetraacyldisaccharide 4'-kinase [Bacteroidota bacterium]MBT3935523.1 tetraacyldisaccharide 4'-kinase [Bacteroidota bacterium]
MKQIRIIFLFPFSFIYGLITFVRNKLFDFGILASQSFSIPIISVGNLAVGGSGKTPMIIYLVDYLISQNKNIAVLSRGYKRETKGYKLLIENGNPAEFGDEVVMIQNKFPQIKVAVAEKRVEGVKQLLNSFPDMDIILLDDAFQHRTIKPGFSLLLTDYYKPFWKDLIMPSGYLREWMFGYKRADVLLVTKTPENAKTDVGKLSERFQKPLFETGIEYQSIFSANGKELDINQLNEYAILLFTGIDKPKPLLEYVEKRVSKLKFIQFPDHHQFSESDINRIASEFTNLKQEKSLILTSEKDFSRIKNSDVENKFKELPLHYISIRLVFLDQGSEQNFKKKITDYVR